MTVTFSESCERDIREALHVRVAVYPAVRGECGERVQLEVSDCPQQLGFTSPVHRAGHYLVVDADPDSVVAAAARIRKKAVELVRLYACVCGNDK